MSRGDIYELGGWTLVKPLGQIFKFEVRLSTELIFGFDGLTILTVEKEFNSLSIYLTFSDGKHFFEFKLRKFVLSCFGNKVLST